MIFGNPSRFAIHVDPVGDWCQGNMQSGIFDVYLNWRRLGAPTASFEVLPLQAKMIFDSINLHPVPVPLRSQLLGMPEFDLLKGLAEITNPRDASDPNAHDCRDYLISPDAIHDKGFVIFRYLKNNQETLLGGSIKENFATTTVVPSGFLKQTTTAALQFCSGAVPHLY